MCFQIVSSTDKNLKARFLYVFQYLYNMYINRLDNEYYKVIINETWRQRDPGDGKYQWETLPAGAPKGPPPPGRRRKRDVAQVCYFPIYFEFE